MIPKRYRRKNNRMSWSYVIDRNGDIRPNIIKMGFNPKTSVVDLYRLLKHLFPYKVYLPQNTRDDAQMVKSMDSWLETHLSAAWQLWTENTPEGIKEVFYFETEADWLHFKLRWT